jgi:hypothetical protein
MSTTSEVERGGNPEPLACAAAIVNKPLGIAYGTGELPAMIASSRDYHAYRSQGHVPGDLIPIASTNHFTILDELRQPNSTLTRAVIAMAQYQTA